MTEVEEVRLHERLRALQKKNADFSTRASAAASAAADEAQHTVAARRKTTWALEQQAELLPTAPAASAAEDAELEDLEDDTEMLRQQIRAVKALWKRVTAERDQLLRRMVAYGEGGVQKPHADEEERAQDTPATRRLTPEEEKNMARRLSTPHFAPEVPKPNPMPLKLSTKGWVERKVKKKPLNEALRTLYDQPRLKQVRPACRRQKFAVVV